MSEETYIETLFSLYPKPLELIEWQEKEITNLTSELNNLRAKLEAAENEKRRCLESYRVSLDRCVYANEIIIFIAEQMCYGQKEPMDEDDYNPSADSVREWFETTVNLLNKRAESAERRAERAEEGLDILKIKIRTVNNSIKCSDCSHNCYFGNGILCEDIDEMLKELKSAGASDE